MSKKSKLKGQNMKTNSWKLSALASAFILSGCGGSSTTDTAITTSDSLSKITGTVPGTLIEAFCADGSYYSVKSTDNNTAEHPFEIEIPNTVSCSLVMTTNEDDNASRVVTQIGMITATASGTLFTAHADIDLGNIPLAMDPSAINDINGDHVSDDILNIPVDGTIIVVELENPLDDDDDGLVNVYEDYDDDGISNYYDNDDDGDGIDDDLDDDNDGDDIEGNDNDHDDDGIDDDSDVDSDDDNDNTTTNVLLPTAYKADAGRLLGSQCAQCHGTNGISTNEWDSIAGEDDLVNEIFEDDEPIMSAQAHGYTEEEIILIGNWLKTLSSND
jgi:cytochrome c553